MATAPTLNELISRWQQLRAQGETSSLQELCADCPDRVEELRQHLEAVAAMEGFLDLTGPENTGPQVPSTQPDASPKGQPLTAPVCVTGYEILGELGRGGMGVVYKARQTKLNRVVALKMILAGGHAGSAELARFQTEAEAIARLHHANIVQVHEVGEHDGRPFFSLEFCEGGSLKEKLNGTPLPPREAVTLVETLARAMQAAHDKGIIHRDLKPANVLLTDEGTPKIADFGLAKKLDEAGATQSGDIMGTPSYMAPEQASGKSKVIGPATDVYALGAILYEGLTGRPPFKAATTMDTLLQVVRDEPVPPRQLQPKTPRDLETICLKYLRKEPEKRYASAAELAEDLRRISNGEPIMARPVGRGEQTVKWVRRNPVVAGLLAALAVSVAVGLVAFFVKYLDAQNKTVIAQANEEKAIDQGNKKEQALKDLSDALGKVREESGLKDKANDDLRKENRQKEEQLAITNILYAQTAWQNSDASLAQELLARVPAEPYLLRRFEWHYLRRQYIGGIFMLQGHTDAVMSAAFSPDGARLATASGDKTAQLWDARTGQSLVKLKGYTAPVLSVTFSPDGTRLATASGETAQLWDARTGQRLREFKGHTRPVQNVAFSHDGMRLATASYDRTARLWDVSTGQSLLELKGHTGEVQSVAFSPDGTRLATASWDQTARLWDTRTGQSLLQLKISNGGVQSVAFSPDGARLATAGGGMTAELWDAHTGQFLLELKGHTAPVLSVMFSPDGTRLATAGGDILNKSDCTARPWDARTGQALFVLKGHTAPVLSVAFNPDGTRLATASQDSTARLWDARPITHQSDADELASRLWATGGDPDWHMEQLQTARKANDWYAAVFQVNRLLEFHAGDAKMLAERRAVVAEAIKADPKDAAALLAHARLSLVADKTADYRKTCAALYAMAADGKDEPLTRRLTATCVLAPEALPDFKSLLAAFDKTLTGPKKYPEDLRIQAGLLLRAGQPEEAVKRLFEAKKNQDDTPHEDLLLALAYHQLNRPDDARKCLARAVTALDRTHHERAAGNAVLSGITSPLHALTALQQPALPDWRERMLGWQGWLDLQLLRREAEAALKP